MDIVEELRAKSAYIINKTGEPLMEDRAADEIEKLRRVIAWANNSLYGSHGFFLSANGGPDDEHHLARQIEKVKASARAAQ